MTLSLSSISPYSIPNFIVSIYSLSLGVFVLWANPKSRKNQLCFLLLLASFVWLFAYGVMYSVQNHDLALKLGIIGHIGAVLLTPIIYGFMLEVLGPYKKKFDAFLFRVVLILSCVCAIATGLALPIYIDSLVQWYWGYYLLGGPLMIAFALFTFLIAFRSLYILYQASQITRRELKLDQYQRFKYYSLAISIFIIGAIDYLPKFGFEIYPCGYVFVAGFSSLITYAIVRHKLLDIDIIIKRSFVYSLLVFIVTFIYLVVIFVSEFIFRSFLGYKSILVALTASGIVALVFNPLRLKLQKFIDKVFYKIDSEKLIAENIKLRDVVEKQDHLKSVATLAAGMAHEIKNPLTSIRTFAEYLPKKYDDPKFRETFVRIVMDEVDRVNNIVKQLLEFSKPKDLELKKESLHAIAEETLGFLNSNFLKANIQVKKKYEDLSPILVDKNQIKQVFLNLFLNSIQAMPQGGVLDVSILPENDSYLWIRISDTGCGIAKKDLEHVFDPFYSTKESGTGLGLAIVYGIVKKHGGEIKIKSEVGGGTMVEIGLPQTCF